jgi:hypothetical protein
LLTHGCPVIFTAASDCLGPRTIRPSYGWEWLTKITVCVVSASPRVTDLWHRLKVSNVSSGVGGAGAKLGT